MISPAAPANPLLAAALRRPDGLVLRSEAACRAGAYVDFFWRGINRVGEFDGLGKYLKEEFTKGRTTAEVVMAEKRREDRVRACGPTVSRWDWPMARNLAGFGAFLHAEGIPRAR